MKKGDKVFFFQFKLEGAGCSAGKSAAKNGKSPKKKGAATDGTATPAKSGGGKCPINNSISERKAAGSIVALVNQGPSEPIETFKFKLNGAGAKVSMVNSNRKS